jgi:carboxymethylenebutenolidase
MKKLVALTFAAFCTAAFLSYSYKTPAPQPLTPECYVSCFTTEIMDQFKAEASTASFAMMHDNPIPYVAADPLGKPVTFKAADGTNAMVICDSGMVGIE